MRAKKQLGQNFLVDKNKINSIISSLPNKNELYIEVGPGKGAITIPLLNSVKRVIAIEIDKDMIDVLNEKIDSKNFLLINEDILDIDWNDIVGDEKNINFISNLPYYISTKIMFKVAADKRFKTMSIMLQKELVDRIFAKPFCKTYGRITVSIGSIFNLKERINVPAGCFSPKPNVDSGFIVLERKEYDFCLEDYLYFVKCSFSHKRKTIINSLKNSNYKHTELVKKYFNDNNVKLNIRSEEIEIETFIDIFKYIEEKK